MTIEELLSIPKGMKLEEYDKLLKEKKKLHTRIGNLSDKIQDEEFSLEVLEDEKGSERYNNHLHKKQKAEEKREKEQLKLQQIERRLKG